MFDPRRPVVIDTAIADLRERDCHRARRGVKISQSEVKVSGGVFRRLHLDLDLATSGELSQGHSQLQFISVCDRSTETGPMMAGLPLPAIARRHQREIPARGRRYRSESDVCGVQRAG